jgi:hypothetical protein
MQMADDSEVELQQPQTKNTKKQKQKVKKTEECCHLAEVPSLSLQCQDTKSGCEECSDQQPGRNWECLHCRKVLNIIYSRHHIDK